MRAGEQAARQSAHLAPAGAPLPTIQIEPIQPQEELRAIAREVPAIEPDRSGPAPEPPAEATASDSESPERIKQVQTALQKAGFSPGPADGRLGPRTRAAIKDFQMTHGLQADGKVGPKTWEKMAKYLGEGA
ncbi:MAG: hypothetical protein COV76_03140 [Candidatus Omnitrophica bacterium CG11_big_fil_rev_8_21_14_0_20_64_10]|nr:MAG: hypothetical protein COV76_03140 [Candidatus Omnitrophica bacterium CG11_big_fil_rev_8_21_14_0_20_64_10]